MGTVDWSSHSALVRNAGPIDEAVRLLEQAVALIKPLCDPSAPAPTWRLTDREAAVLSLLREGRSNREISRALGISVHTARTHVSRVLAKFYVRSRWQLLHRPNDLTAGLNGENVPTGQWQVVGLRVQCGRCVRVQCAGQ